MSRFNEERMKEVFSKTIELLQVKDYSKITMNDIAKNSKASKETLYKKFGSKQGLFEAIIISSSKPIGANFDDFARNNDLEPVLTQICFFYLMAVLGMGSVAFNRMAISEVIESPELAELLLENGRNKVYKRLVGYFEDLQKNNVISNDTTGEHKLEMLLALAAGDLQIRRLLNELDALPDEDYLMERSKVSAKYFIKLFKL